MSDFTDTLTKKIGPLPGWAYVALGVGGILLYRRLHRNATATPAPSQDQGYSVTTPIVATPQPTPVVDNTANQLSPADFAAQVAQYMNATTAYKPNDIQTSLDNFLNGFQQQNAQQQVIINHALSTFGDMLQNQQQVMNTQPPVSTYSTQGVSGAVPLSDGVYHTPPKTGGGIINEGAGLQPSAPVVSSTPKVPHGAVY